jgi:Fe-S-cluster containining protein
MDVDANKLGDSTLLPTVQALEDLWAQLNQRPLWAAPHFFRYLKLRWQMRLKLLDPARVRINAPQWQVNDCGSCSNLCCIGPRSTVLLRLKDIAALIDIGRTDLIAQTKPQFAPEDLAKRPALRRQVASSAWKMFPVLKQNKFNACMALTTEGRCGLYPHWPLACARFPYALHLDDVEVFYSGRCDSFWIRPDAEPKVTAMKVAAVAAYNERIKDAVLLAYSQEKLAALGLLQYLKLG